MKYMYINQCKIRNQNWSQEILIDIFQVDFICIFKFGKCGNVIKIFYVNMYLRWIKG